MELGRNSLRHDDNGGPRVYNDYIFMSAMNIRGIKSVQHTFIPVKVRDWMTSNRYAIHFDSPMALLDDWGCNDFTRILRLIAAAESKLAGLPWPSRFRTQHHFLQDERLGS